MQIQPRRLNGDAVPADLLLGCEPITERIAFPSGLPALLENLIRPLPDLRVRTDADHRFLLPVWLAVERLAQVQHFKNLSLWIRQPRTSARDCSDVYERGGLLTVAFFPFRKVFLRGIT